MSIQIPKIHEDYLNNVQFVTGSLTHYEIDTGDTAITDAKTAWDNAAAQDKDARYQEYKEIANNKGRQLVNTIGMRATVVLTGTFGSTTYASNTIHIAVENSTGWNTGAYPYTTSDPQYSEHDKSTYLQDMLGGTWTVSPWEY